jgi:hypothetical protein
VDARRAILRALLDKLANDYDLDPIRLQYWVKTDTGLKLFIRFLNEEGYEVKVYRWPPDDDEDPLSWGLEFEDDNNNFILLKLKHMDQGNG